MNCCSSAPVLLEKYLQISDFILNMLESTDDFLEDQLQNLNRKEDEQKIISGFLIQFLLAIQETINFDQTVMALIDNNVHSLLIDELFEQTNDAMKPEFASDEDTG